MLALAAVGCGGDDGPTRAAWSAQANAVCRDGTAELRAVRAQIDATARLDDAAVIFRRTGRLVGRAVALTRPRVDRLDVLPRPAADRAAIDAWLQGTRRQLDLTAQLGRAFTARDEAAIARLSTAADREDGAGDDRAAALGLTDCVALG